MGHIYSIFNAPKAIPTSISHTVAVFRCVLLCASPLISITQTTYHIHNACMWLLYYVCVLQENPNFLIIICGSFGAVHDYYQIWSKSSFFPSREKERKSERDRPSARNKTHWFWNRFNGTLVRWFRGARLNGETRIIMELKTFVSIR